MFNPDREEWGLWLKWVLASSVGWVVGWGGVVAVVFGAFDFRWPWAPALIVGGPVGGPVVGAMQWFILRQQVSRAGWWVLASSVGLAVGWVVGLVVALAVIAEASRSVPGAEAGALVVVGAVPGAVVGAMQWCILRRQVSRAGWWVLASSVGLAVGWVVGLVVGGAVAVVFGAFDFRWPWAPALIVGGAVFGAVAGAITGIALVWLFRQPVPELSSASDYPEGDETGTDDPGAELPE